MCPLIARSLCRCPCIIRFRRNSPDEIVYVPIYSLVLLKNMHGIFISEDAQVFKESVEESLRMRRIKHRWICLDSFDAFETTWEMESNPDRAHRARGFFPFISVQFEKQPIMLEGMVDGIEYHVIASCVKLIEVENHRQDESYCVRFGLPLAGSFFYITPPSSQYITVRRHGTELWTSDDSKLLNPRVIRDQVPGEKFEGVYLLSDFQPDVSGLMEYMKARSRVLEECMNMPVDIFDMATSTQQIFFPTMMDNCSFQNMLQL